MLSTRDVSKVFFAKNLISTQNFNYLTVRNNTAGVAFNVSEGCGEAASNSSVVVALIGGFADQKVTAEMKYVSPTLLAASDIGVMARFTNPDSTGVTNATYYFARVDGGVAKITKVVTNTFTNLITSAYALAQGDIVSISLTCKGSSISATFYNSTLGTLTLAATDTEITNPGLCGFRSLTSSIWVRSIQVEQL